MYRSYRFQLAIFGGLLALSLIAPSASAQQHLIMNAGDLKFTYQTEDQTSPQAEVPCTHAVLNADAQDWTVKCGDGANQRSYTVHLWLTPYQHATGPNKISYELLYWITDNTDPRVAHSSGTTIWFHLRELSSLASVQANESVEDDTARLAVEIQLNARQKLNLMPSGHVLGRQPRPEPAP